MTNQPHSIRLFSRECTLTAPLVLLLCAWGPLSAQDDVPSAEEDTQQRRSRQRMALMMEAVKELAPRSSTLGSDRITFAETPILRYNDTSRQFFDASVWRLGTEGRPTALLTLEWYGSASGSAKLMREFCSLSSEGFSVEMPESTWQPQGTDLTMRMLADVQSPADTSALRLVQMRALARRFTVESEWNAQRQELRLVPQPIDRYSDQAAGIVDGAIFSFATGTNPELALLLEAGEDRWSYGTIRVALAALDVSLDGEPIESYPAILNNIPSGNYFSASKRANLPD